MTTVHQDLHVQDLQAPPDADAFVIQTVGSKFRASGPLILEQSGPQCLSCLPLLYLLAGLHSFKKVEAQISTAKIDLLCPKCLGTLNYLLFWWQSQSISFLQFICKRGIHSRLFMMDFVSGMRWHEEKNHTCWFFGSCVSWNQTIQASKFCCLSIKEMKLSNT